MESKQPLSKHIKDIYTNILKEELIPAMAVLNLLRLPMPAHWHEKRLEYCPKQ